MQDDESRQHLLAEPFAAVPDQALALVSTFSAFISSLVRSQKELTARVEILENELVSCRESLLSSKKVGSENAERVQSISRRLDSLQNSTSNGCTRIEAIPDPFSSTRPGAERRDGPKLSCTPPVISGAKEDANANNNHSATSSSCDTFQDKENRLEQEHIANLDHAKTSSENLPFAPREDDNLLAAARHILKEVSCGNKASALTRHVSSNDRKRANRVDETTGTPDVTKKSKVIPKSAPNIFSKHLPLTDHVVSGDSPTRLGSTTSRLRKNRKRCRKKVKAADCYEAPETFPLETSSEGNETRSGQNKSGLIQKLQDALPRSSNETEVKRNTSFGIASFSGVKKDKTSSQSAQVSNREEHSAKENLELQIAASAAPAVCVKRLQPLDDKEPSSDEGSSSPWLKIRRNIGDQWETPHQEKTLMRRPGDDVENDLGKEIANKTVGKVSITSSPVDVSVERNHSVAFVKSCDVPQKNDIDIITPRFAAARFPSVAAAVRFVERRHERNLQEEQGVCNDVVRGAARHGLDASACKECENFFRMAAAGDSDPEAKYQSMIKHACRHRHQYEPVNRPHDYWKLSFDETPTQAPNDR